MVFRPRFRFALVASAFLTLSGAAVASDSQLVPSQDSAALRDFIRLRPLDDAPTPCDEMHVGVLALDRDTHLCVCSPGEFVDGRRYGWLNIPHGLGGCGFGQNKP